MLAAPTREHCPDAPRNGTSKAAEVYNMGHIRSLIFSYLDFEALQDVIILSRVGFPDAVKELYRRVEGVRPLEVMAGCESAERAELYREAVYRVSVRARDAFFAFLSQTFGVALDDCITLQDLERILPDIRQTYPKLVHLSIALPDYSYEISMSSIHQTPVRVHIDTAYDPDSEECPDFTYRNPSSFTVSRNVEFFSLTSSERLGNTGTELPAFIANVLRENLHGIRCITFREDVIAMSQLTDAFDLLPLSTGDQPLDLVLSEWHAPDFGDFGRFSSIHGHRLRSFTLDNGNVKRRSAWLRLPDMLVMYSALRSFMPLLESLTFPLRVNAEDEQQCLEKLVEQLGTGSITNMRIDLQERPVIPLFNIIRLLGTLLSPTGTIALGWNRSPTLLVSSIIGKPAAQQRILSTIDLHAIGLTSYGDISRLHFDENDVPSLPSLKTRPPWAYTVSGFIARPPACYSRHVFLPQPRGVAIAAPPSSSQEETTDSAKAKLRDVQQYLGDKANRFAIAHHFRGIFKMFDQKAEAPSASPSFT